MSNNQQKPSKRKLKTGLTNLKGDTIGYLYVIGKAYTPKGKRQRWKCKCTADGCGKEITVAHNRLIDKNVPKLHCGCQRGGLPKQYPREYHTWWDAKSRCHNPDHPSYPSYGAKGIRMCDRWLDEQDGFKNFLEDLGKRPKGMSLDRIDPHGHYSPENTRWACIKTQARNKKGTIFVEHPDTGKQVPAAQLAEELGITYQTLRSKLMAEGKWGKPLKKGVKRNVVQQSKVNRPSKGNNKSKT